jgi:hypothetical protein
MKNVVVTYMAEVQNNGIPEQGEAAMSIQVSDGVALALLVSKNIGEKVSIQVKIEEILRANELLKGRCYVPGSIKCFRADRGGTP